nr:hypothetical protein [uncultured Sphaerochaeta sp.]
MNTVIKIGIDVHKDSYSLSAFTFNNQQCFGQTRISSKSSLVIKYVNRMKKEHQDTQVVCGYEARPTGIWKRPAFPVPSWHRPRCRRHLGTG